MLTRDLSTEELILARSVDWIVINKPAGVPSVPDKTGDDDLLTFVGRYLDRRVYPIHRLDRPVSGCMVIALSKGAQTTLSAPKALVRRYMAVVSKNVLKSQGTLEHFLLRDGRSNKSRILKASVSGAKQGILHYRRAAVLENYDVVEVALATGRFHQIRAQLAAAGAPIRGDVKYGARRSNPDRSIDLHAFQLTLAPFEVTVEAVRLPESGLWKSLEDWKVDAI